MKEAIIEFEEQNNSELMEEFIKKHPELNGLNPDNDIDTIVEHPGWYEFVEEEFVNKHAR